MLEDIAKRGLLIGREWVTRTSGGSATHVNPASGECVEFAMAGGAEVDAAVAMAASGAAEWTALSASQRSRLLHALADRVEGKADAWAQIAARETGMPVIAGGGSALAVSWMRYYAGWPDKIDGSVVPPSAPGGLDFVTLEPYGVVAVVMTWNSPLISVAMKALPALAAGNAVVIKAPELAPFTLLEFGAAALEAGLPPGVVNVVTGGAEAGQHLVAHEGVGKITFTGGGEIGRAVMQTAAARLAPVTLELGGKSPHLVFADADVAAVTQFVLQWGIVALSGQGCANPTRMLIEDDVYDEVASAVVRGAELIPMGDPLEASTIMGPLISAAACARVQAFVERAVGDGAGTLLAGGKALAGEGCFFPPTVLGDVDPASEIAQEEVFGPVLCLQRFRDEAHALELANGTRYGLSAYVFTQDVGRALRVARGLDAGNVHVNGHSMMSPTAPFGGYGQSGFGREGGRAGLEEFLRTKNVFVSLSWNEPGD